MFNQLRKTICMNFKFTGGGVLSIVLFFILSFPLIYKLSFNSGSSVSVVENRKLSELPSFKKIGTKQYSIMLGQYIKDQMSFRQFFMSAYIYVNEVMLESYVSEYVTGKGKELFMNHAAPVVDAALGILPYGKEAQELLRLSEAGKYAFYYSKHIPYYLFIAPDKSTLYPELLPFYSKWIKHEGWYSFEIEALKKANIPFYEYKDVFDNNRMYFRMYDEKFDNCHWNGNALMIAYTFMAEILSKDNSIFKAVKSPDYYGTTKVDVSAGVYGKDKTTFIKINKLDNIVCGLPTDAYDQYHNLCVNKNVSNGTLWFYSDSYFGETHGSLALTPFVHNVHTYLHSHYGLSTPYYTQVAYERMSAHRPDAVIEEFVERMGGPLNGTYDPLIRILGDIWLKTGGFLLDSHFDYKNNVKLENCNIYTNSHQSNSSYVLRAKNSDPIINFEMPVIADYLGRVVIMGNYSSPEDTFAQIFYKTSDSSNLGHVEQNIQKGKNIVHITVHVKPFEKVYLRFDPGAVPGDYVFEDIQEVNDLRNRMKEDGI